MREVWVAVAFVGTCWIGLADNSIRRKYIGHGWDTLEVSPEIVLANADALARTGLDGITIALPRRKQSDGSEVCIWDLPTDVAWKYETYADQVPIMREISRKPSLGSCFLSCGFTPMRGRLNWQDDEKWGRFAGNMRIIARIAHEGGMRGLFLDNEDYCNRNQFVLAKEDGDYPAAFRLARKRGREVFGAVFEEFPEAVVMPFWLLTQVQSLVKSVDPIAAMRNSGSLWPAFVNGLLDVIPASGRVVDGNENAYTYEWSNGSFDRSVTDQLVGFLPLVAKENRAKYRAQTGVGFGLYIDMYVNEDPAGPWYFKSVNGSRLEHFKLNLTEATRCADEYVWIYGEKVSWVKWKGLRPSERRFKTDVTWEDKLPGLSRMMKDVKNPGAGLMDRVLATRKKGASVNLFPSALAKETHWVNPDFKPVGTYEVASVAGVGGTITLKGIRNGCSNLPIDARPGETYVYDMWMTGSCGDREHPTLCFMDDAGKFHWDLGTVHASLVEKDSVGRSRFCALVHVPENMHGVNLMLNGSTVLIDGLSGTIYLDSEAHNGEVASFTDIFIARCDE